MISVGDLNLNGFHQRLHHGGVRRVRAKSLCLSEIMTMAIAFHQHHYRNFKHYYLNIAPLGVGFASVSLTRTQVL